MANDINKRLRQLRARRDGTDRIALDSAVLSEMQANAFSPSLEAWEKRGSADQPHTKYAIGAMQSVGSTYTRVSEETADRVANQLRSRLNDAGIYVEFRLQGSVPLDIHIRRVSDVDLLTIETSLLTYVRDGAKARRGGYTPTSDTSHGVLNRLRVQVEKDLTAAFPMADVDKTGAKAVKISGGSLPRSVDVVPAHWYDNAEYQATENEAHRGITIYDKKNGQTIENFPFLHIERIKTRCVSIGGGLRKAIRLCKSVKADSDRDIKLSSFDIASAMYHSDMSALRIGQYYDLAILAETQRFLDYLACNPEYAKTLDVPDGSRKVFDTDEKIKHLVQLSYEMDELLANVYKENSTGMIPPRHLSEMRTTVRNLAI